MHWQILLIEKPDELAIRHSATQIAGNNADRASIGTIFPIDDLQRGLPAAFGRCRRYLPSWGGAHHAASAYAASGDDRDGSAISDSVSGGRPELCAA